MTVTVENRNGRDEPQVISFEGFSFERSETLLALTELLAKAREERDAAQAEIARLKANQERMICNSCGTITRDGECDCDISPETKGAKALENYADAMCAEARRLSQAAPLPVADDVVEVARDIICGFFPTCTCECPVPGEGPLECDAVKAAKALAAASLLRQPEAAPEGWRKLTEEYLELRGMPHQEEWVDGGETFQKALEVHGKLLSMLASTPAPASAQDELRQQLRTAVFHIEHMAEFIGDVNVKHKTSYSFESLGEDMPSIRAALSATGGANGE